MGRVTQKGLIKVALTISDMCSNSECRYCVFGSKGSGGHFTCYFEDLGMYAPFEWEFDTEEEQHDER